MGRRGEETLYDLLEEIQALFCLVRDGGGGWRSKPWVEVCARRFEGAEGGREGRIELSSSSDSRPSTPSVCSTEVLAACLASRAYIEDVERLGETTQTIS